MTRQQLTAAVTAQTAAMVYTQTVTHLCASPSSQLSCGATSGRSCACTAAAPGSGTALLRSCAWRCSAAQQQQHSLTLVQLHNGVWHVSNRCSSRQQTQGKQASMCRPVTLERLLELRQQHPEATLVAGHSEVGIERKYKQTTPTSLLAVSHVPELCVAEACPTVAASVHLGPS